MNWRRLRAEREYPQLCRFCSVHLELGKTISSYTKWRFGICNRCWKIIKKVPQPHKLRKDVKIKDSIPQRILFEELKRKLGEKYLKYNYPIRTQKKLLPLGIGLPKKRKWNIRYADVAYTKTKVIFEYDGEHYHNEEKDRKRDDELRWVGWKVIHVNRHNMQDIIDNCKSLI